MSDQGGPRILLQPPVVGDRERELLIEAVDSGWIAPAGPALSAFEAILAEATGADAVVALSSGTAALHLGLLALGVQPGDRVVVQTATFAATAFAVTYAGAEPVFCDVDRTTGNLDPDLLARLLADADKAGTLPAAVIPVDLYGHCADYKRLREVCEPFGVPILQDAAESLGSISQGTPAASHGALGILSFNGNKIITTSGGGALVGPPPMVERVRKLSTQAREPGLHYEHAEIGFNYRLSNLLAAVGVAQVESLEDRIGTKAANHVRYVEGLPELTWFPDGVTERWNHWLSVAFLPEGVSPFSMCEQLMAKGIEARPFWKPMHLQPVFANNESVGGEVADMFFETGICLPSGYGLTAEDQDEVIAAVNDALESPGAGA